MKGILGAVSEENVQLVERMVALFNERGIRAVREFGHPEIEFHEPPEQPGARVARGTEHVELVVDTATILQLRDGRVDACRGTSTPPKP